MLYDYALNLRISSQLRAALEARAEKCGMQLNEYARLILTHAADLSPELPTDLANARTGDLAARTQNARPRGSTPVGRSRK